MTGNTVEAPAWRERWRPLIFIAVGLVNTGAFFVLANLFTYAIGFSPKIAAYISYAILMPVSFFGHRRITFGSKGTMLWEWAKFCATQAANVGIIGLVTEAADSFPILVGWLSFAIISIIIPALNFMIFHLWVFSKNSSN
ncbi:GtrA family protein [Candidatus Phyllobacterium onerii]|uniref:GtrA family protein n=1 Tax=Candidatus Phyllobacterium onerii TaxID=3020828 RepID=UPI00232EB997|nr:GtrA family protein [Phyllobacterium sp. IY22]